MNDDEDGGTKKEIFGESNPHPIDHYVNTLPLCYGVLPKSIL